MHQIDLIKKCQQNNYKAQLEIYELYKDMLYNTSWHILKNNAEAQDVVHDSFIKGFKNINQLKGDMNLGAWLKRIVINKCLDVLKYNSKTTWLTDEKNIQDEITDDAIEINNSISIDQIIFCIDQLKEKHRVVLTLFLLEDYTHKEIAEFLKLNESTVRNQYIRGKKHLKELIKINFKS